MQDSREYVVLSLNHASAGNKEVYSIKMQGHAFWRVPAFYC